MKEEQANELTELVKQLVEHNCQLRALAIVGSWARGDARPQSDLDLIVIAVDQDVWRRNQDWVRELAFPRHGFQYREHVIATYGVVWSVHIALQPHADLELTFAAESWASTDPIDAGTRRVIDRGIKVIVDKDGGLARLLDACKPLISSSARGADGTG